MPPPYEPNGHTQRVTGFLKAHKLRGKEVPPELLVPGGWHVKEGRDGAARLMALPASPTAIVAPNDMAAIGAITKLKELGLRVPDDVAVVGYDNIAIAEWYNPSLTTVDQPHYQMGQQAMQAMLKRLENPNDAAEMVKFDTSLIVRRSSGAPKKPSSGGTP
jgi:DNA-binding LacI/PurR family transcriptional regulator